MSGVAAIQAENLRLLYGQRIALDGVSFSVRTGEIFGLLGPNGGGKSSLFRVLSTLLPPSGGAASVAGFDVVRQARQVRSRIGIVFQAQNLDRELTAAENLRHQGHLYGLRGMQLRTRIDQILAQLGLLDRKDDLVKTLSGGQRRRVELAKGLLHQPSVLLLDEPSTGLDPAARLTLWNDLRALRDAGGVAILLATHLLEEAEHCDRLAILDRGRVVASGTPEKLKADIGGEVIVVDTPQPEVLRDRLQQRFSLQATALGGKLRFEHPRGHEFIPQLVEAFPGEIQAVRVSKPTLEDVFLHRTGRLFGENGAAVERAG